MSTDDRYIPGVPCWVDTTRPDPETALAFYGGLFGWEFDDMLPAGAPERYLIAQIGGGAAGAIASGEGDPAWNSYVLVADADATAQKVRDAGGQVLAEPFDVGEAGRMAVCADPQGARFSLWQAGRRQGATVVNEHGGVNFNDLHTTDVEGARAFYGAVFGWEILHGAMWALPGYGDFLEGRTPGMREGMRAMGAPERFEDVVATVAEAPAGTAASWGVTFAVDDADEIARRAAELGGTVEVEPHDAPWTRVTTIRDPDGAVFVAGQFVPPETGAPAEAPSAASDA